MEVQHDIRDSHSRELVNEIFSNPAYHGKMVVIFWHHGNLPAIAWCASWQLPGSVAGRHIQYHPGFSLRSTWIFATIQTPVARRP